MMNQVENTQQEKKQLGSYISSPSNNSLKRRRSSSTPSVEEGEASKRSAPLNCRVCEIEDLPSSSPTQSKILEPDSIVDTSPDLSSPAPYTTSPLASSDLSQDDSSCYRARRRRSLGDTVPVAKDEVTSPSEDLETELVEHARFSSRIAKLQSRRAMMMKEEDFANQDAMGGPSNKGSSPNFEDEEDEFFLGNPRPNHILGDEMDSEEHDISHNDALNILRKIPHKIVSQYPLSEVEQKVSRRFQRNWPNLDQSVYSGLKTVPDKLPNELEWVVENAVTRTEEKILSESYEYHGIRFRIMMQAPKTNRLRTIFAIFLECLGPVDNDGTRSWNLPGLSFHIIALNVRDWRASRYMQAVWPFPTDSQDRGWTDYFVNEPVPDFLGPNGELILRAAIFPKAAEWRRAPKQESSKYVGLRNHGATCYMNSLMQHLYHIGQFRKAIFEFDPNDVVLSDKDTSSPPQDSETVAETNSKPVRLPPPSSLPVDDSETFKQQRHRVDDWVNLMSEQEIRNFLEEPDSFPHQTEIPISVAIQNLFYKMSSQNEACDCRQMLKAFGWGVSDAFDQHDATELMKIVVDRLEHQLVQTPSAGQIEKIFGGSMASVVRCINVEYESVKKEKFYDLVLMVKNSRTLESAIRDFGEPDILDGDNMYDAEGYGRQRATKFMKFVKVPMVLNCMLRRLEWDCASFAQRKVTDVFEFPKEIDFSQYNEDAGMYDLHAVVVHSGDASSGHYYTFVRPQCKSSWLKFDDDKVSSVPECAAIYDNFGGRDIPSWNYFLNYQPLNFGMEKPHSAYMLTYVNRKYRDELLQECRPSDVNTQLVERKNLEESKIECQKMLAHEIEVHIKLDIVTEGVLMRDETLGFWSDTRQLPAAESFKVKRQMPVSELLKIICDKAPNLVGYPEDSISKVGMWYFDFDSEVNSKSSPNALRLWTFEFSSSKPGSVADISRHLQYVDTRLVERFKPTFRVLVHPLPTLPNIDVLQRCNPTAIKIFDNRSLDPSEQNILFLGFEVFDDALNLADVLDRVCRKKLAMHAKSESSLSTACAAIELLLSQPEQLIDGESEYPPKLAYITEDQCFHNEMTHKPGFGLSVIFYPRLKARMEAAEWARTFGFAQADVYEQTAGNGQVSPWKGTVHHASDVAHIEIDESENHPAVTKCQALHGLVTFSVPPPPISFPPYLPVIPCVSPADWWEARESKYTLAIRVWDLPRFFGLWRSAGGDLLNDEGSREYSPSTTRNGACSTDPLATPTSVRSATDPDSESPLSGMSGWSRSITMDVDARWPFRLAFRYLAYQVGVHEDYLLLTADSPLDNRRQFTAFHAHSFVGKPLKLQEVLRHILPDKPFSQMALSPHSPTSKVCHMSIIPRSVNEFDFERYGPDGHNVHPQRQRDKPILIRVMNSRHDSIGFVIVTLLLKELKVRDVIKQAERLITDEMRHRMCGSDTQCAWRLVETLSETAGYVLYEDAKSFRILSPDNLWTEDVAFSRQFDPIECLRLEPCLALPPPYATVKEVIESRHVVVRVHHRGVDGESFGFPFEMLVHVSDTVGGVRERIFNLLNPPIVERQKWRVFRLETKSSPYVPSNPISGAEKDPFFTLRLREEIDLLCARCLGADLPCLKNFRVLIEHPNPLSTGQTSRRNVPLHIK